MNSRTGVLRCLMAAVLFGVSAPLASTLAGDMSAAALAGLLYLGAGIAVAPAVLRRRPEPAAVRAAWKPLSVAVVAGGALGPLLLIAGLARIDAATASILLNLELVATVALAATLFREHLGRRLLSGAALVTIGGALLVWQPGAQLSVGALLIAAACACWGLDNCVTARIDHVTPETVVLAKGFVAGSFNLALGLTIAGDGTNGLTLPHVAGALVIGAPCPPAPPPRSRPRAPTPPRPPPPPPPRRLIVCPSARPHGTAVRICARSPNPPRMTLASSHLRASQRRSAIISGQDQRPLPGRVEP